MNERPAPRPGVDPLFTEDDAEEILDFLDWEQTLCAGCGHPKAETFDPENEFEYDAHVVACAACAAGRRAVKKLDDTDGVYTVVTKKAR